MMVINHERVKKVDEKKKKKKKLKKAKKDSYLYTYIFPKRFLHQSKKILLTCSTSFSEPLTFKL